MACIHEAPSRMMGKEPATSRNHQGCSNLQSTFVEDCSFAAERGAPSWAISCTHDQHRRYHPWGFTRCEREADAQRPPLPLVPSCIASGCHGLVSYPVYPVHPCSHLREGRRTWIDRMDRIRKEAAQEPLWSKVVRQALGGWVRPEG